MIVLFFLLLKNTKSWVVLCWSLQKFLKLIHYILSLSYHVVTWGLHRVVTSAQTFPSCYVCAIPSDSLPGRSFKRAAVSTMWTEVTNRTEHLFLLLFSLVNLSFALEEWTAKSFQSLLLLPWHFWPLVKVSQLQNSAIKRFSG